MDIINLTPHTLTLILADSGSRAIAPSGAVARCTAASTPAGSVAGVALVHTAFGEVSGLPDPVEGVLYVVSALVRTAVPERKDVASPGDLVRDADGNVTGCRNLIVNG